MASHDPLGDMLAMIKNANTRGLEKVQLDHSNMRERVARVFARLGEKKNRARARIKFLVARLGLEEFKRLVLEERAALSGGTPADWGRESWELSRTLVYPIAFDIENPAEADLPEKTALTQEDIVAQLPALRRRVQQAGLRMANLLDEALG